MKRRKSTNGKKKNYTSTTKRKSYPKPRSYVSGMALARPPPTEKKAFDLAQTTQTLHLTGSTPTFTVLNLPINGAELYMRIGRKIYMRSLHLKYWLQNAATAVQSLCRIAIVYDTNPNAVLPVFADVFKDSNAAAATTLMSGINLNNRARFQIIRDSFYNLGLVDTVAGYYQMFETGQQIFQQDMFIKLRGLESEFNATNGGTIADIQTGALYLISAIYNGTAQDAKWNLVFQSRLRYYD